MPIKSKARIEMEKGMARAKENKLIHIQQVQSISNDSILELREPFWGVGGEGAFNWGYKDKTGFGVDSRMSIGDGNIIIKNEYKGIGDFKVTKEIARQCKKMMFIKRPKKGNIKLIIIPRELCTRI